MDTFRSASVQLNDEQRLDWLQLFRTPNVGPVSFKKLIGKFGSARNALDALPDLKGQMGISGASIASRAEAEKELDCLHALGGRMVAYCESTYPELLAYTYSPPPLLSLIGGEELDLNNSVSIVGSRNSSAAGKKLAHMIARDLGQAGIVVVSGLARGIDTAAHLGSLESGTVAVFAGGIDHIYPHENADLAKSIVDHGGMLVAESPMGAEPKARDFPRRNRIVAGIARGTLVVEAAKRSGSLITSRMAMEQDREVFAIPGSPLDPRSEGGNALIRQGATLVRGAADILEELETLAPARPVLREPQTEADFVHHDVQPDQESAKEVLLNALSVTPTSVDDLILACGLPAAIVQGLLLELDIDGTIERSSGQLVALR